jgi:hypothetical protein
MRVIAHENFVELIPENVMENEAIERWQRCNARVQSYGVVGRTERPWFPRKLDVFDIRVQFDPKPGVSQ